MDTAEVDALLAEFQELTEQIQALQKRKAEIAVQFPQGRTEGTDLAIYRSGAGYRTRVDLGLLRHYVSEALLDKCRVGRFCSGGTRMVAKRKPKQKKGEPA